MIYSKEKENTSAGKVRVEKRESTFTPIRQRRQRRQKKVNRH